MTRDRDFKAKVRARMARTGERYAAARAQLVDDAAAPAWTALAGAHPETTALARLAAAAGAPVTEAMVLGAGGGLGGAYFVFEYKGVPPTFYVATRCYPQYPYGRTFVETAARRLGLPLAIDETGSKVAAARQLAARVATGPVIAWVDRGALPWATSLPGAMGATPHVVVVAAIDGDDAIVHDTGAEPHRLPLATLAGARAALAKEKHRLVALAGPPPRGHDLAAGVREAIASCAAELAGATKHTQMAGNFGIGGIARWARLVVDERDKKGWPRLFAGGVALWQALTWGHHWIERGGTGGGAFRPLYAAFLDEAAAVTRTPRLREAAAAYRALGAAWTALAGAMLPDRVPLLRDTRAALVAGDGDLDALRARADAGELDADAAAIRADLGARLAAIVADETAAARLLAPS